ncbi:MAG: hypothetical protein E5V89_04475 [Mesorhizobium sp.]|nr:MAG: hypothetical protein E5W94_01775 [Mesorhizobium sp.]TIV72619.1 MAG: hypothetical protein E5V89_04475 [Mesorhizobium sp.]
MAARFGLTAEEREQLLPSGKQHVLHNRIHWAKFYMSKAGLLASRTRAVRCHRSRSVIAHQRP